jgi:hypothetical protein
MPAAVPEWPGRERLAAVAGGRSSGEPPDVELIDLGAGSDEPVRIVRGNPGRGHRTWLVAIAVVAAVATFGLIATSLGGDAETPAADPDPSPWTERDVSTTTAAPGSTLVEPAPSLGPLVPGADGVWVVTSWRTSELVVVDLGTGRAERLGSRRGFRSLVAVRDGVVASGSDGLVHLRPGAEPVPLGLAELVVASGEPDAVWSWVRISEPGQRPRAEVRLVDLSGAVRAGPWPAPANDVVVGGRADAVFFSHVGGAYRSGAGGITPVPGLARVDAAAGNVVVGVRCGPEGRCGAAALRWDTRTVQPLQDPVLDSYGPRPLLTSDGSRVAFLERDGTHQEVTVLATDDGQVLHELDLPDGSSFSTMTWLPRDLGIVLGAAGGSLHHLDLRTGTTTPLPAELRAVGAADAAVHVLPG